MASGTDLKVMRVRAHLTQRELASRMGISRQALWALERAETVDPDREAQYRAALSRPMSADADKESAA